jgi:hypothetical protein
MSRRLVAVVVLVAGLACGLALRAVLANPWGLVALDAVARHATWLWAAGWVLAVAGLVLLRPPRAAVVAAVLVALPVAYVSLLAAWFDGPGPAGVLVARTAGPDGEVRVVRGAFDLDAIYQVRLRRGHGLLVRERTVWQGGESDQPPEVREVRSGEIVLLDEDHGTQVVLV